MNGTDVYFVGNNKLITKKTKQQPETDYLYGAGFGLQYLLYKL